MFRRTVPRHFFWPRKFQPRSKYGERLRGGHVQFLARQALRQHDLSACFLAGYWIPHRLHRQTQFFAKLIVTPGSVELPVKCDERRVQPRIDRRSKNGPGLSAHLSPDDLVEPLSLFCRRLRGDPYLCGAAAMVDGLRPFGHEGESKPVKADVAALTFLDSQGPPSLTETLCWRGIEVARTTPIAAACRHDVCLVAPPGRR